MQAIRPLVVAALTAMPTAAQCTPSFVTGDGVGGVWRVGGHPSVETSCIWDPPGPAGPQLVIAGAFDAAGTVRCRGLAAFDLATSTWSPLPGLVYAPIDALLAMPNGDLVVAGPQPLLSGVANSGLVRWDGTAWSTIGAGLPRVHALALAPNGDLLAGGVFALGNIGRWNGSSWSPMGTGTNSYVADIAVSSTGEIVITGGFSMAGTVPAQFLARWAGVNWLGFPPLPGTPYPDADVATMSNGDVVLANDVGVHRFNGTAWTTLPGLPVLPLTLLPLANNELLISSYASVRRWNGTAWTQLGSAFDGVPSHLAALPSGEVFVGGAFTLAGTTRVDGTAIWNGTQWRGLGTSTEGVVYAVAPIGDGTAVVGGSFDALGGVPVRNVARHTPNGWQALGNGVDGSVTAAVVLPNQDVVVAGDFQSASGIVARRVARWNGTTWLPLSSGCNWIVNALAVLPNGELVAGGEFTSAGGVTVDRLARWNGTSWSDLGGGVDGRVLALHVEADGSLLVGGQFTSAGGVPITNLARWNGVTWSPVGPALPFVVRAVTSHGPTGRIVAGGESASPNLHRFDGTAWSAVPTPANDTIRALATLPNGDVFVSGTFAATSGVPAHALARWTGSAWLPIADVDAAVHALAFDERDTLWLGGAFTIAGQVVSARVARLVAPCPGVVATAGPGCAASSGTPALTATRPWRGGVCTLRGSGVATTALPIVVLGAQAASLPLAAVFPVASPSCVLRASPDLLVVTSATGGATSTTVPIPDTAALVGVPLHAQLVGVTFGAGGVQELAASNAVTATIGAF